MYDSTSHAAPWGAEAKKSGAGGGRQRQTKSLLLFPLILPDSDSNTCGSSKKSGAEKAQKSGDGERHRQTKLPSFSILFRPGPSESSSFINDLDVRHARLLQPNGLKHSAEAAAQNWETALAAA